MKRLFSSIFIRDGPFPDPNPAIMPAGRIRGSTHYILIHVPESNLRPFLLLSCYVCTGLCALCVLETPFPDPNPDITASQTNPVLILNTIYFIKLCLSSPSCVLSFFSRCVHGAVCFVWCVYLTPFLRPISNNPLYTHCITMRLLYAS